MIRVGILLSPLKAAKLKVIDSVRSSKRSEDIEFYVIDPLKSLEEQKLANLDVMLHRLHDHVVNFKEIDCAKYVELLNHEVQKNNIKMLCPTSTVDMLADRVKVMNLLQPFINCECGSYILCIPETFEITIENISNGFIEEKLKHFPIVMKSTGCSFQTSERYLMKIYFELNDDDKKELTQTLVKTRLAAQQFVDHGGRLYKMFILGDKWHVVERKSIKNLNLLEDHSTITFMSNCISKIDSISSLHESAELSQENLINDDVSCGELFRKLNACFNCPLLGVDFIVQSGTKNIFIIDVNYFPGYDGFSEKHHLGDAFIDLFLSSVKN